MSDYELPIRRASGAASIPKRSLLVDYGGAFVVQQTTEVRSNSIQLNMILDKLLISCRRLNMLTSDADAFF